MMRRSVSSDMRRSTSRRAFCAPLALGFALTCFPVSARAEAPELLPAEQIETDTESQAMVNSAGLDATDLPASSELPAPKLPPRESDDLEKALERRGDLNFHGLSLNSALFTISEQWNVNIVAGEVQGTVNGVFKQAPLREILDSILLSNGYNYRIVGKSLVVSSVADLGQVNPFFQSATIKVHTADIDEVVEGAKLLNTPQGQVKALKSVRSIVVLDFPDRVTMIREFVAALDGASGRRGGAVDSRFGLPQDVAHFRTQHIRASDAATAIAAVMSKDGRVTFVEKDDRLVITDYAENLAVVEKVLDRIDRPRPQVRITALIYDISLQDIEQLGLSWNKFGYTSGSESVGIAASTAPFNNLTLTDGAIETLTGGPGNVAIGTLSTHFDINAVLMALQQARDARLLADPNVAVLENEQATFKSVREIPIQQLTETAQGGNIGTTAFREAGIILTVTPKIASDCTISMEVAPEFSRFVGTDDNGQPIIDTREARTTLRVANRQTIVIAGLRQRDDIGDFNGIPYLKDLKYVGRLFRSRNTTVRESELVVFISPEIIDASDEPDGRQKMAENTVRCRLDQIPEGEGCPACCRRLPPEMMDAEEFEITEPATDDDSEELPSAGGLRMPPLAASRIPSSEFQFGVAGRSMQVRTLVAEGRLRRLPAIEPQLAEQKSTEGQMFRVPLGPQDEQVIRTANGSSSELR